MILRKTLKAVWVAAGLAGLISPARAQDAGDWVLSQWHGSAEYYPGVITDRRGDQVKIRFDDGDVAVAYLHSVRPFDWVAGSWVECRWTDGNWYPATIRWISDNGSTMQVRYDDDGTVQRTNTGRCRSR